MARSDARKAASHRVQRPDVTQRPCARFWLLRSTGRLDWRGAETIGVLVRISSRAGEPRESRANGYSRGSNGFFLPGVLIEHGELRYQASKLMAPSDLLHEAGHIAVTPYTYRHQLDGALTPEQAFACGGEVEAIAWSFAAAAAIGMPLSELFHPAGYRGQASGLAMNFALGVYPGVHGLIGAGLAANVPIGKPDSYPKLLRWLRE